MAPENESQQPPLGEFLALPVSPWSYRARWVLEHHGHTYTEKEYQPIVSELFLRVRLGFPRGKITAPILFPAEKDQKPLCDSALIARYADERRTRGESLFPQDKDAELQELAEAAERCMEYERHRAVQEMVDGKRAPPSSAPEGRRPMGKISETMMRMMMKFWFMRKYNIDGGGLEGARKAWQKIQEKVKEVGPDGYLVGGKFSYADILVVTASALVKPVDSKYYPKQVTEDGDELLKKELEDVLLWRDRIYEKHFPTTLMRQ